MRRTDPERLDVGAGLRPDRAGRADASAVLPPERDRAARRPAWEPPVDVFEDEREVVIVVAMPGVPAERVQVTQRARRAGRPRRAPAAVRRIARSPCASSRFPMARSSAGSRCRAGRSSSARPKLDARLPGAAAAQDRADADDERRHAIDDATPLSAEGRDAPARRAGRRRRRRRATARRARCPTTR